jgi:hypothetical protein
MPTNSSKRSPGIYENPWDVVDERAPRRDRTQIVEEAAEVADAVAEIEAARVAAPVASAAARRQIRPLELLMVTLLAVSLIIHMLTLSRLFSLRDTLRGEIEQLADTVQRTKNDQVRYNLPIDEQVPINVDVPIRRSLTVPIQTEVRIKQDITIPVDTVFGRIDIPVPIDANIPINTTVPIEFDQTVNISTTVPIKLNVPIQIDMGSSQIASYLDRLHDALLALRDKF